MLPHHSDKIRNMQTVTAEPNATITQTIAVMRNLLLVVWLYQHILLSSQAAQLRQHCV